MGSSLLLLNLVGTIFFSFWWITSFTLHLSAFLLPYLSWQAPSFLSLGDGEVCYLHIVSLSCSAMPVSSQRGNYTHIWCPNFCDCHSGDTPYDLLVLEARGFHEIVPIGERVLGSYNPQDTAKTADQNISLVFLWKKKKPIYLFWSFGMKDRLQVCLWNCSRELGWGMPALSSLCGLFNVLVSPRKEIIHSSGALSFCNYCQGETSRCHGLEASRVTIIVPQDCIYLHTFKSGRLRVWFPLSLKLSGSWDSFSLTLGHWQVLTNT